MLTLPREKQLCWLQYNEGKTYQDFILSLMAFPYSNICYCNYHTSVFAYSIFSQVQMTRRNFGFFYREITLHYLGLQIGLSLDKNTPLKEARTHRFSLRQRYRFKYFFLL